MENLRLHGNTKPAKTAELFRELNEGGKFVVPECLQDFSMTVDEVHRADFQYEHRVTCLTALLTAPV